MANSRKSVLEMLLIFCCALTTLAYGATPEIPASPGFTLQQVLAYPFPSDLIASSSGDRIAWVINLRGLRNVWVAEAPAFTPRQVTHFTKDNGQEITQLTFSPSGNQLVFVRGGDHDSNWPYEVTPNPASSPVEQKVMLWAIDLPAGSARAVTDGDAPAISDDGRLAYIKRNQVWTASLDPQAAAQPHQLFFDHGQDGDLQWSPDGKHLAFVSNRGAHAFIGVFTDDATPMSFLAPSSDIDSMPCWSPDGSRIAFKRQPGRGGPLHLSARSPEPWSIVVADARTGQGHALWASPETAFGTSGAGEPQWVDHGKRLVFMAYLDGWSHLYSVDANGGKPLLLTPGAFMVQDVALSPDSRSIIYSANTGKTTNDHDRRHLFRVPVNGAGSVELTKGTGLQWSPTPIQNAIVYIDAGAQQPPRVAAMNDQGGNMRALQPDLLPRDFPTSQLLIPKSVTFKSADGTLIHGQLFRSSSASANQPGIIFVHGGPGRQMLLGWHLMNAYSSMYAVNQYSATHGFIVLSVNYRRGIGYGHNFQYPVDRDASYQDVLAGAKFLQNVPGVDAARIGIWGASAGGSLTALALARNSDIFKAGVDMLGGSNSTLGFAKRFSDAFHEGSEQQREALNHALQAAWEGSPDASMATWKSPVLLIQGDNDHNVPFAQTEDIVPRLRAHHVPFEQIVIPNEVHDFRLYSSWLRAYDATMDFLHRKLGKD